MPVEVLVMCPRCARPQPPASSCVHCGATLPAAPDRAATPAPASASAPDAAAPHPQPAQPRDLDVELGGGLQLLLRSDALELKDAAGAKDRLLLADLRRVRLEGKRPIALMLGSMVPLFVGLALVETFIFRGLFVVLLAFTLWFFLRSRTWALILEPVEGPPRRVAMGGGTRGTGKREQAQERLIGIVEALRRRGVEVDTREAGQ